MNANRTHKQRQIWALVIYNIYIKREIAGILVMSVTSFICRNDKLVGRKKNPTKNIQLVAFFPFFLGIGLINSVGIKTKMSCIHFTLHKLWYIVLESRHKYNSHKALLKIFINCMTVGSYQWFYSEFRFLCFHSTLCGPHYIVVETWKHMQISSMTKDKVIKTSKFHRIYSNATDRKKKNNMNICKYFCWHNFCPNPELNRKEFRSKQHPEQVKPLCKFRMNSLHICTGTIHMWLYLIFIISLRCVALVVKNKIVDDFLYSCTISYG